MLKSFQTGNNCTRKQISQNTMLTVRGGLTNRSTRWEEFRHSTTMSYKLIYFLFHFEESCFWPLITIIKCGKCTESFKLVNYDRWRILYLVIRCWTINIGKKYLLSYLFWGNFCNFCEQQSIWLDSTFSKKWLKSKSKPT